MIASAADDPTHGPRHTPQPGARTPGVLRSSTPFPCTMLAQLAPGEHSARQSRGQFPNRTNKCHIHVRWSARD